MIILMLNILKKPPTYNSIIAIIANNQPQQSYNHVIGSSMIIIVSTNQFVNLRETTNSCQSMISASAIFT